jgi:hypothetical protein
VKKYWPLVLVLLSGCTSAKEDPAYSDSAYNAVAKAYRHGDTVATTPATSEPAQDRFLRVQQSLAEDSHDVSGFRSQLDDSDRRLRDLDSRVLVLEMEVRKLKGTLNDIELQRLSDALKR